MKKLTALLLSAATILTLATPAFAVEENAAVHEQATEAQVFEISDEQFVETAQTEIPDAQAAEENSVDEIAPQDVQTPDGEQSNGNEDEDSIFSKKDPIAIIYLCVSGPAAHYGFGHTWICIKNISKKAISIGDYEIKPGKMSSFGLHHFDGMHINDEMRHYNHQKVTALAREINAEGLAKAEKEILSKTWKWYEYLAHNCTNFATTVWLRTTGQFFLAFCFPFIVQIQMACNKTEKLAIEIDD
ncbi:MAG: hypothetical protein IKH13_03370 [Clostridia bacterium]|nr:hypothetical protein [Clostridia bacterium]